MPAVNAKNQEFTSTAPDSSGFPSASRRAAMACVPTEMADKDPPNIHKRIKDGKSAACAVDDSGHGRWEKKTMSISFTMLCDSIASTVGAASRRMTRYGEPCVTTCVAE